MIHSNTSSLLSFIIPPFQIYPYKYLQRNPKKHFYFNSHNSPLSLSLEPTPFQVSTVIVLVRWWWSLQWYGCSTPLQRQAKLPLGSNVQIPLFLSQDGHKSWDGPKPEFRHAHSNVFNSLSFLIVVTPTAINGILTTDLLPSNSENSPTSFVKSSFWSRHFIDWLYMLRALITIKLKK